MAVKHSREHEEYIRRKRAEMERKRAAARRMRQMIAFILLLVVIALICVLTQSQMFKLSEIKVTGSSTKSHSEIAGLSGLRLGMNILSVDKKEIQRNFSMDSSVELLDVHIEMPDTVIIEIRERVVHAAVNCAGVILLIDSDGYVLQRLSSMPQNERYPLVSGMDVRVSAHAKIIESGTDGQLTAMKRVLTELYDTHTQTMISELNIADPDNIYLISQSGIQILLGDDERLDEKLAWTQAVIDSLTTEGVMSGVVDVSSGSNAVFSPT